MKICSNAVLVSHLRPNFHNVETNTILKKFGVRSYRTP